MKYTVDEIVALGNKVLDETQINEIIDNIARDVKLYKDKSDIAIFENVLEICTLNDNKAQIAKMYRNIGMYYFYNTKTYNAFKYMYKSLEVLKRLRDYELLVAFLSDLGLLYFYEMKYEESEKAFNKARDLLPRAVKLDQLNLFLLYYRTGILYNYMKEFLKSRNVLRKALACAPNDVEKGRALMNLGINCIRQNKRTEALEYYAKALELFEREGETTRIGIVYNNMACVYKLRLEFDKALEYVGKAFELLQNRDMQNYLICFQTYAEIKIRQGESAEYLQKLVKLLWEVKDFFVFKCYVVQGYSIINTHRPDNKETLQMLYDEIIEAIEAAAGDNEEYRSELTRYLGEVCFSLKVLSTY